MSRTPGRAHYRWLNPRFTAVGIAAAGLVVGTLPMTPAQSAAEPSCPGPVPMDEVNDGMPVTGLTVTRGTEPDSFTGEVLGVLDDGVAPGLDMIMVRLEGSEITDQDGDVDKGVWSGMSGSPIYDEDGRLLGAVAYGLSYSPSDIAGVTPGAEMLELLESQSTRASKPTASRRIAIPQRVAKVLVARGDLTSAQASNGFKRLPMPFSVSGLSNRHLQKVAKRFDIKRPMVVGSSTSAADKATEIVAGGNLAASISYGDVTYAGIGTATAVCGEEVLAFGHPMLWTGKARLSMHGAEAIYIQHDNLFGSFKVANLDAPVGIIDDDRLAGIHGTVGEFPKQTDITSDVTSTQGGSREGHTVVTLRSETPFISAIHLLVNADRVLDKLGRGSAKVRWSAEGVIRSTDTPWSYTRVNRYASAYDITFESIYESYRQLRQLQSNKFPPVRITDVHYKATYDPEFHALQIAKFELKLDGQWVTVTGHRPSLPVPAGSDLKVRLTLQPRDDTGTPEVVKLSVRVPKDAKGNEGTLYVSGGGFGNRAKATSFDELLVNLSNAPRNDEVTAVLRVRSPKGGGSGRDLDSQVVSDVVSGNKHVHLKVR